ncbi:unnamed protein product [Brachionus calyciflorus]|uniref:Chitin-binding type-2 domain-containing protein n=1 Tax=Brachionus calyciflorus TaxID=104777 RepID=A0A813X4W6_9BILA|nr:unnamed protein product [Brachionus calyciflorus]
MVLITIHQAFSLNWIGQNAYDCDFSGNDIKSQIVNNFEACWINCLNNPNCTHYAFRLSDNSCYPKSKNGISQGEAIVKVEHICGIIDRTKQCLEMNDYSPEPSSCRLYYRCINDYLNLVGCLNNQLFDPSTKECSNYSSCYYGCRNSTDKVGYVSKTEQYYDCQTNSTKSCGQGQMFDLRGKKCIISVLKNSMFELKKNVKFSNVKLEEIIVNKKFLCLKRCIKIINCKIVQYKDNICKIFDELSSNFQPLDYNDAYFKKDIFLN